MTSKCSCYICETGVFTCNMFASPEKFTYGYSTTAKKSNVKENKMSTIREKIRYAALPKDERMLREAGILSDNGNLTDDGRRVVLDFLFEDAELRKRVVKAVETTLPKEK